MVRLADALVGDGKSLAGEPRLVADRITQRARDGRKTVGVLRQILASALGEQADETTARGHHVNTLPFVVERHMTLEYDEVYEI